MVSGIWWKEASIYQIYPSSFQDSNNDGIGDIPGIISRLDYIKSLNVDAIWLCPCFKSPQVDMGYDISDYKDIHEPYGTMSDIDELIDGLHKRDLKILMDLVVNHTSDQHEWFKESRKSKDNEYRDLYIWKKGVYDKDGVRHAPNNWGCFFSGSAWEYDELTDEYYLHLFAKEQPDLNWENPKVVDAVKDIIKFWLDKGVDGFRLDALNFISKESGFKDTISRTGENARNKFHFPGEYFRGGPKYHNFLKQIGTILNKYDAFSVGEMGGMYDPNEFVKTVSKDRGELNTAFQFELSDLDLGRENRWFKRDWTVEDISKIVGKWQKFMYDNDCWNALFLENHDLGRSVSRFTNDDPKFRDYGAKLLSIFLSFQSGTLFIYQGQEIGTPNVSKDWKLSQYRDLDTLNPYKEAVSNGATKEELESMIEQFRLRSRDNGRTPVQWNNNKYAGFSNVKPWIDVKDDYLQVNVESQENDPKSTLNFWRNVLSSRKSSAALYIYGLFEMIPHQRKSSNILAYIRRSGDEKALIVCNFSKNEVDYEIPVEFTTITGSFILHNYDDEFKINKNEDSSGFVRLRPYEAFVYQVNL